MIDNSTLNITIGELMSNTNAEYIGSVLSTIQEKVDAFLASSAETTKNISELATEVIKVKDCKYSDCVKLIEIHVGSRSEFNLRGSVIHKSSASPASDKKTKERDCALKHYDKLKSDLNNFIDAQFEAYGSSHFIQISDIADIISKDHRISPYIPYFCVRHLVEKDRADLFIKRGRYGGVGKKEVVESSN